LISVAEPTLGQAEALQRSMLELIESVDRPYYADPIFWAPFVVVGEGGAA
jgi:CHAT domain-containing protein